MRVRRSPPLKQSAGRRSSGQRLANRKSLHIILCQWFCLYISFRMIARNDLSEFFTVYVCDNYIVSVSDQNSQFAYVTPLLQWLYTFSVSFLTFVSASSGWIHFCNYIHWLHWFWYFLYSIKIYSIWFSIFAQSSHQFRQSESSIVMTILSSNAHEFFRDANWVLVNSKFWIDYWSVDVQQNVLNPNSNFTT